MKKIFLSLIILGLTACNSNYSSTKLKDSLKTDTAPAPKQPKVSCPITVLHSRLIEDEYGSTSISVSIKNISKKTIDAVSLSWILTNNFGDVVNDNYGGGISQHKLKPSKTGSYEWDLYRTTATKCTVFITKVHFTDDSKWQLITE